MSDTVKIIIEIPKDHYELLVEAEELLSSQKEGHTFMSVIYSAVANGTPLDDVKAELEKHQFSREYCCDHNIDTAIDMGMVRIILDSIGRK